MSVKDTSGIVFDDSRVMLQIVVSLSDDSRGIIYDCNMFILQATGRGKYDINMSFCLKNIASTDISSYSLIKFFPN